MAVLQRAGVNPASSSRGPEEMIKAFTLNLLAHLLSESWKRPIRGGVDF